METVRLGEEFLFLYEIFGGDLKAIIVPTDQSLKPLEIGFPASGSPSYTVLSHTSEKVEKAIAPLLGKELPEDYIEQAVVSEEEAQRSVRVEQIRALRSQADELEASIETPLAVVREERKVR